MHWDQLESFKPTNQRPRAVPFSKSMLFCHSLSQPQPYSETRADLIFTSLLCPWNFHIPFRFWPLKSNKIRSPLGHMSAFEVFVDKKLSWLLF
jgi:hypothetical protein